MSNLNRSYKPIKYIEECFVAPKYIFPKELANSRMPGTRTPALYVGININNYWFPIDEPVYLNMGVWGILNQNGILKQARIIYPIEGDQLFDPIRCSQPINP